MVSALFDSMASSEFGIDLLVAHATCVVMKAQSVRAMLCVTSSSKNPGVDARAPTCIFYCIPYDASGFHKRDNNVCFVSVPHGFNSSTFTSVNMIQMYGITNLNNNCYDKFNLISEVLKQRPTVLIKIEYHEFMILVIHIFVTIPLIYHCISLNWHRVVK